MGYVLMDGIRYYRIRQFGFDYLIPWHFDTPPTYEVCLNMVSDYYIFGDGNAAGVKRFKH